MVQIRGIQITDTDALWLVDELLALGAGTDATAALDTAIAIETAVAASEPIALTPVQREAVADALMYAPTTLEPLRRKLTRTH